MLQSDENEQKMVQQPGFKAFSDGLLVDMLGSRLMHASRKQQQWRFARGAPLCVLFG